MSNQVIVKTGGFPVLGLLGVLFIGLKLTGYINWGWLWITAPFWFPLGIVLGVAIFALCMALLAALLK